MLDASNTSTCPVCREPSLRPIEIEPLLPGRRCERCSGQWIRGESYFRWCEHPDRQRNLHPSATAASEHVHHDTARAMLCPDCGRLLTRCRVGHGLDFSINHCGGCGGIWLDATEWESLRASGLSDRIHFVFSAAWQAQVQREQQQRSAARLLRDRIGESDFAELERLIEWIEKHPHREQVTAWLIERLSRSDSTRFSGRHEP